MHTFSRSCVKALVIAAGLIAFLAAAATPQLDEPTAGWVNGEPITRQALEAAMPSLPASANESATALRELRNQTLRQLLDQRLLAQAALRAGLHQRSDVHAVVARTRRQLLRTAYIQQRLSALPQPGEAQIDAYIASHAAFFKDRKTYHFSRTWLDFPASWTPAQQDAALRLHPEWSALISYLKSQKIQIRTETQWLGSEQILPDQLSMLEGLKNGQFRFMPPAREGAEGVLLLRIAVYDDPRNPTEMRGAIARGLLLQAIESASQDLTQELRQQARIVFPDIDAPLTAKVDAQLTAQVAAWVNDEAITSAELDEEVNPEGQGLQSVTPLARSAALDVLIAETLAAQRARAQGLDRDAKMAQSLSDVATQVQIVRFVAQELARQPKPTLAQARALVKQRAKLLSQRKMYRFDEIVIRQPSALQLAQAQQGLGGLRELGAMRQTLQQWQWPYSLNSRWTSSEKLSADYFQALHFGDGKTPSVLAGANGQSIVVLRPVAQYDNPLSDEESNRMALQVLQEEANAKALRQLQERLRAQAKIQLTPDLMGALQWGEPQAFLLSTLSTSQAMVCRLIIAQCLLLGLLVGALVWFHRLTQSQWEWIMWTEQDEPRGWQRFTHSSVWLGSLPLLSAFVLVALMRPLPGLLKAAALPREALILALSMGLSAMMLGWVAAYAWRRASPAQTSPPAMQRQRRWPLPGPRWWPLLTAGLLQTLFYTFSTHAL